MNHGKESAVMNAGRTVSLMAAVLVAISSLSMAAESWDASADYSAMNNPSGAWSYGRKWTVEASAMDLFTVRWGDSGWYLGNVGHGGPSIQGGANMWAKNNSNGYPCDRWTCPTTGRYNIRGRYNAADARGMDSYVYVVINGSVVFSSRIQQYPQSVAFTNDNVMLN
jgi:hypothetical protein